MSVNNKQINPITTTTITTTAATTSGVAAAPGSAVTTKSFRTVLDCRARPHYIMLADSRLRVSPVPVASAPYYNQWINYILNEFGNLGPNTAMSIHLGFYRTQKHFHLHFVGLDLAQFRLHWIQANGTKGLAALEAWEQTNQTKTQKYMSGDIAKLRAKLPTAANSSTIDLINKFNVTFSSSSPIIHIPVDADLSKVIQALREIAYTLGIHQKRRGGHMCVRPVQISMPSRLPSPPPKTFYHGWLLLDLDTYYSIHPDPSAWLLAFEANKTFNIWT